ncbi:toprim domain-containing protein [Paenibacillus sp. YN15]|uniref:toprim domain-containing protein n=1 Tax=Paenibacillus sp. YN15 TaxID=1742774 RepID=UPI000DCE1FB0|nr:toprim domain-containing protein [Paenibacillus sp. YN15]RAU96799.1 hypothetical protein DQG13_19780 [Paenibacillus sp. YN15]
MSGTIRIHNVDYPVDVRAELEDYGWTRDNWTNPRRFQASSPFRYDKNPSFFVDTDESSEYFGCWSDSAADDPEWRSGNFTKLLAFLRNETYAEAAEYLALKYGEQPEDDALPLRTKKLPNLAQEYRPIALSTLERYKRAEACPYLTGRCVSADVQRMMRVGYDAERKAVVIPWFNADGTLGNVKFRKVAEKTFWYTKGGRPIREMLYGIDIVYRRNVTRACIVEAEIDAMTLMSAGMAAIATGGATFTEDKRRLIVQSPLEEIVIVRDNDRAGRRWRNEIYEALRKDIRISFATIPVVPLSVKDPNEYAQAYGVGALRAVLLRRLRPIATLRGGLCDMM